MAPSRGRKTIAKLRTAPEGRGRPFGGVPATHEYELPTPFLLEATLAVNGVRPPSVKK